MTAAQRTASGRHRPETRVRPPLRVVDREPARQRRDARRLVAVVGAVLFAGVLAGNVAVQAQTTQGQFELERLQKGARERQARYQQLRLEVAELEAPVRIVERALEMGMVEPARVTYLAPTAQTSAQGPSGPSERGSQGPSGPSERGGQGPSGAFERGGQGPSGPSERGSQGPSGPSERGGQGPSGPAEQPGHVLRESASQHAQAGTAGQRSQDLAAAPPAGSTPSGQAAHSWSEVKPHLDRAR